MIRLLVTAMQLVIFAVVLFTVTKNGSLAVRTGYGAERACCRPAAVVVLMQLEHGTTSSGIKNPVLIGAADVDSANVSVEVNAMIVVTVIVVTGAGTVMVVITVVRHVPVSTVDDLSWGLNDKVGCDVVAIAFRATPVAPVEVEP
jgi:hypothetical protein